VYQSRHCLIVSSSRCEFQRFCICGHVVARLFGPGGWINSVSPSAQTGMLASPEAAERAANIIGHLLQQDAVLTSRPLQSGSGHFFQIAGPGKELADPSMVQKFFTDLRAEYPKVDGFMPVQTAEGGKGISILKMNGHFNDKDIAALQLATEKAATNSNIEGLRTKHGPAEVRTASNDWKENPNGEGYTRRLGEIGRPGLSGRLVGEHAASTEEAIRSSFRKHAPEALGGDEGKVTQTIVHRPVPQNFP